MASGFTSGDTYTITGPGVPEISVTGNGLNILNGDDSPSASDHTDFGTSIIGGETVRTFTIQSIGTGSLTVGAINTSGSNAADFIVTAQPASLVVRGNSTTFQVAFRPTVVGLRTATLSFTNSDSDENPFDFTVHGMAVPGGEPGSVDPGYYPNAGNPVFAAAVQPDRKTIIGGQNRIARLATNGSLDGSFSANGSAHCAAVQADGKILIGGGPSGVNMSRLNTNGTVDTAFNPSVNVAVRGLALDPDGNILIRGFFTVVGGTTRRTIARLHTNGTLDTDFAPNANVFTLCMAVQADGKILIGGPLDVVGTTSNKIARLHPNGAVDPDFNQNANATVLCMAVQADGKILIGGDFTVVGETTRNRIARLHTDGTLDTDFDSNANGQVRCVALQADGKILLGGSFGMLSGTRRINMARLNGDGTLDGDFGPEPGGAVDNIAIQADGKIIITGDFGEVGGTTRHGIARLNNDPAVSRLSAPDPTRVVWSRSGSAPDVMQVTFDLSTDGGANWSPIGQGTRVGATASWQRTGLALPANGWLRARGRTTSGRYNGSSGLIEQVAEFPSVPIPPLNLTGMTRLGNGVFQFGFTNVSGATFTVLSTTNLLLPPANWTVLGPASEISLGEFQFSDPSAITNTHRYYLIRSP